MKIYYLYHQTRQVAPAALNPAALEAEAIARGLAGYKIEAQDAIRLQGIGICPAKPAGEFKDGDFMKWNGGSTSQVIERVKETAAFIDFKICCVGYNGDLEFGTRRIKRDRLVAIGSVLTK